MARSPGETKEAPAPADRDGITLMLGPVLKGPTWERKYKDSVRELRSRTSSSSSPFFCIFILLFNRTIRLLMLAVRPFHLDHYNSYMLGLVGQVRRRRGD